MGERLVASANLPGCGARTSSQAALALRPIAGEFAFLLVTLGIVGTGLLAVPVLAGCAVYATGGTFRWRNSLALKPQIGKTVLWNYRSIDHHQRRHWLLDPINALSWSAASTGRLCANYGTGYVHGRECEDRGQV
jgi:hypothetical protein